MPDLDIHRVILDLATEDSNALSELVDQVHAVSGGRSIQDARDLTRRVVAEMLDIGLLETTWLDAPASAERPIDREAATKALADDLAWLPHKHWRPHVRLVATKQGRIVHEKGS